MRRLLFKLSLASVMAASIATALLWAVVQGPLRDPQAALDDFYAGRDRAEDQLIDPLVLNGRRVVPLVMSAVTDRNMPNRRYAIGFLGSGRYREAVPVLERILADDAEIHYFRADALEALSQIDAPRARQLAAAHRSRADYLGESARAVVAGARGLGVDRSFLQALLHAHD